MLRREPVSVGMLVDVSQAQGLRLSDQLPEHPVTTREAADVAPGLVVDTEVNEALQLFPVLLEDAERRVLGPGQLPCRLHHRAQHRLEVKLGEE